MIHPDDANERGMTIQEKQNRDRGERLVQIIKKSRRKSKYTEKDKDRQMFQRNKRMQNSRQE